MVSLGEIGRFEERTADRTIFRKNLERVVYVTAEMAGRGPAYAVLAMQRWLQEHPLPPGIRVDWAGEGEWKITVDVFRDLGIAFGIALIGSYILLVYETKSYDVDPADGDRDHAGLRPAQRPGEPPGGRV